MHVGHVLTYLYRWMKIQEMDGKKDFDKQF